MKMRVQDIAEQRWEQRVGYVDAIVVYPDDFDAAMRTVVVLGSLGSGLAGQVERVYQAAERPQQLSDHHSVVDDIFIPLHPLHPVNIFIRYSLA